jgi:hypothetical protein
VTYDESDSYVTAGMKVVQKWLACSKSEPVCCNYISYYPLSEVLLSSVCVSQLAVHELLLIQTFNTI